MLVRLTWKRFIARTCMNNTSRNMDCPLESVLGRDAMLERSTERRSVQVIFIDWFQSVIGVGLADIL